VNKVSGLLRDKNGVILPSTLQNNGLRNGQSPNRNQREEQKRANSVASGDTIISTASSGAPLKRGNVLSMKQNLQLVGLQLVS
jgi:hypothetical protein